MAIAALVLGILGLVPCFGAILGILAIIFGVIGLKRAKRGSGGKGMAMAGLILGILGVLVTIVTVVALAIAAESLDDAKVGTCMRVPEEGNELSQIDAQPCDEPHEGEVVGKGNLIAAGDEAYPGADEVAADVEASCARKFEAYVDEPVGQTYDLFYIYPSEDAWEGGDGGYLCIATSPAGDDLTDSVKG